MNLEMFVNTPFHKKYKGGLLQYLTDFDNAIESLDQLKAAGYGDEDTRKRKLMSGVRILKHMVPSLSMNFSSFSYQQMISELRQFSIRDDLGYDERLNQRVNHVRATANSSMSDYGDDNDDDIVASVCKILTIPTNVWRSLPKHIQQDILLVRTKERNELNSNDTKSPAIAATPPKPVRSDKPRHAKPIYPPQYGTNATAREVTITDELIGAQHDILCNYFESLNFDHGSIKGDDDGEDDDSVEVSARQITVDVTCSCRHLVINDGRYSPTILDSGADMSVIGQNWHVINSDGNRYANVIGFDHKAAVKKHLPIVSAVTVANVGGTDVYLIIQTSNFQLIE